MSPELRAHRSYLYVPGSVPDRFEKARMSGADVVILDLEDAVSLADKDSARAHIRGFAQTVGSSNVALHVRINHPDSIHLGADLDAAVWPSISTLRVPKVESAGSIRDLDSALTRLEGERGIAEGSTRLTLLIESARGILSARKSIAASTRVSSVSFGASDFLADIAAQGDDAMATLYARSQLVIECRAAGLLPPIDSVPTSLDDEQAVISEASFARSLGFFGKSLIHPRQIAPAHSVFTPTDGEVARAQSVINAAEVAAASGSAALSRNGEFIDPAIVARSRALLALRRADV